MEHSFTRDGRRARARIVCAGIGLGLVAFAAAASLSRPKHEVVAFTSLLRTQADPSEASLVTPEVGVVTLEEVHLYGVRGGATSDELELAPMTLPDLLASTAGDGMFQVGALGVAEPGPHAAVVIGSGRDLQPSTTPNALVEDAASGHRRSRAGAVESLDTRSRAARADDHNERVVKQVSFKSCWENSPGASGRVNVRIVVDPARGVAAYPTADSQVPADVVSCVGARARGLPLRVPADGGSRTFAVSSSYSPQLM